ncbi:MAG: NAD(P)H:quinone oxidoreductase [Candidatus Methanoperedens sp.]|nr:NAD(P)H:quinone oxidoreductase [Candidatus Methanoperedens sp.]
MTKNNTKVLVVFYSMTGNVAKLAKAVAEGAKGVPGAEVRIRQVEELIPKDNWNDVMKKVKDELKDIPIATMEDLEWADGIAFGTPTRYGNMTSQMKNFIDQTGNLWQKGALINKVAGIFTSTSTQHGGQETTIITSMVPMFHHGMIVVGVPYSEQRLFAFDSVSGGSPYGASSVSGPMADRMPTENEIEIAKTLGRRIAEISRKIAGE